MRRVLTVLAIAIAAWIPNAVAQITVPIAGLAHDADIAAIATVERVTEMKGPTPPDRTLTVQLRLGHVLRGQPSSMNLVATLAEKCSMGGGGLLSACVDISGMEGLSGLWLLKTTDSGYQIVPVQRLDYKPDGLFLSGPATWSDAQQRAGLDSVLLGYEVRWIQSLDGQVRPADALGMYGAFQESAKGQKLAQEQILTAIRPLIDSASPSQHAMGLVIALQAESSDAMAEVAEEISTLRSNPRFSEIEFAIAAYPTQGGPGSKSPQWIAPIRRLIAMREDIPGMDSALAAALYRIGTVETWPLIAELLDSKDPGAQMVAVKTIALRVPAALATEETRRFLPGMPGHPATTAEYVEFWKAWWIQNRAAIMAAK